MQGAIGFVFTCDLFERKGETFQLSKSFLSLHLEFFLEWNELGLAILLRQLITLHDEFILRTPYREKADSQFT